MKIYLFSEPYINLLNVSPVASSTTEVMVLGVDKFVLVLFVSSVCSSVSNGTAAVVGEDGDGVGV